MINPILFGDMCEFLKVPAEEWRKKYAVAAEKYPHGFLKWIHVSEQEWKQRDINQQDESNIAGFYQETDNYIPELVEAWTADKYRLSQTATDIIKNAGLKTVVDYGAGIGEASIMHAKQGLEATAVDLPGKTFDFAKWRFKKHTPDIKTIDIIPGQFPLKEQYGAMTCFEVMQHLIDPEAALEHFHEHLVPRGLFIMCARFKGNYALALKENEKYHGRFEEVVEGNGFRQKQTIHMWGPKNNDGKYLEVYQK